MIAQRIPQGAHGLYNADTFYYDGQGPLYVWWRPYVGALRTQRVFISEVPFDDIDYVADGMAKNEDVVAAAEWFADLVGAASGCEVINKGEKQ